MLARVGRAKGERPRTAAERRKEDSGEKLISFEYRANQRCLNQARARWSRRGAAEGTTGEQEEHKRSTRATREEHKRAPPMLLACGWLVCRMYLACTWLVGRNPLPSTWLASGLDVAWGWLSSRSRPHSRSGEKAVGITNDPKNTNGQRLGTTEVLTGLSSGVHFVSRSFMMCLVYSVVSPAVLGFSGPRCLPLPQNCRASLQALSHYPATFHHGRHKCTVTNRSAGLPYEPGHGHSV